MTNREFVDYQAETAMESDPSKTFTWVISIDTHLDNLLDAASIDDLEQKKTICDVLASIGLSNPKFHSDEHDRGETQSHEYTSTWKLRKLAKKYLYSTKHW